MTRSELEIILTHANKTRKQVLGWIENQNLYEKGSISILIPMFGSWKRLILTQVLFFFLKNKKPTNS